MKKGDIVLLSFPFTNLSSNKTRPALILTVDEFDVTVAFITSKVIKQEPNDVALIASNTNGLKVNSLVKLNKLATLEKTLLLGKLGELTKNEIVSVNEKLMIVFGLR